jgi:hypothetical protein
LNLVILVLDSKDTNFFIIEMRKRLKLRNLGKEKSPTAAETMLSVF